MMDNVKYRVIIKEGSGLRSGRDSEAQPIELMYLTIRGACTVWGDEEDGNHSGGRIIKRGIKDIFSMYAID